jgi:hypothetical protein
VGATWDYFTNPEIGIFDGDSGYGKRLKDRCQEWLDKVFKVKFQGSVDTFLGQCDSTNTAIDEAYTNVVNAAKEVTHKPFVRPASTKTTPAAPGPPSTGPSNASPSNASPSNASPSTASPSNASPSNNKTNTSSFDASSLLSQASSALNGLGSLTGQLSSLGQTVSQEASSLSTTIQQGLQGVVSQFENLASGSTGNKPKLEFDIAGKHVKFELGKNGEVDMSTSDGSGDKKSYTMKLDEHGLPVITSADSSNKDDGKSDSEKSGTAGDQAGGTGGGGGDSSGSGTGGHNSGTTDGANHNSAGNSHNSGTSQNANSSGSGNQFPTTTPSPSTSDSTKDKKTQAPASDQQPKSSDGDSSGAELAEAGPL